MKLLIGKLKKLAKECLTLKVDFKKEKYMIHLTNLNVDEDLNVFLLQPIECAHRCVCSLVYLVCACVVCKYVPS